MSAESHGWWDRELDNEGQRIRSDVRAAAKEIWERVQNQAKSVLGDGADAGELIEESVAQASRYLDRKGVAPGAQGQVGLLLVVVWRLLERRRAKLSRLTSSEDIERFSDHMSDRSWSNEIDSRLDFDKIVRQLSDRSRTVLALRSAGYAWSEIAKVLDNGTATKVKGDFWREVRQVGRKIHSKRNP